MPETTWQEALLAGSSERCDPETGKCYVGWGDVELPPTPVLEKRALAIVSGCLTCERWTGDYREYLAMVRDTPGEFVVDAHRLEGHRMVTWSLRFREAGDVDLVGTNYTSGALSYDHALAWLIAVAEEHHAERCAEELAFTGGLA